VTAKRERYSISRHNH